MTASMQVIERAQFPQRLLEIPQPPVKLHAQGIVPNFEEGRWLAVVGSRKYSSYGKDACEYLVRGLRGHPVVIVSGLALGIDAIAHQAALDAGLRTVAVPGSGLHPSVLYPKSNHALARRILNAGGCLLSEYESTQAAAPWTFPQRNRVMVGLSHAVLLIEASERSGTLITARLTGEYDRDLLSVPGSIFSEGSKGTHQFLRLGATPVATPEEVLEALGIEREAPTTTPNDLSPDERLLHELLGEPLPRDTLIEESGLDAHVANALLSMMELRGITAESEGMIRRV